MLFFVSVGVDLVWTGGFVVFVCCLCFVFWLFLWEKFKPVGMCFRFLSVL